MKTAQTIMIPFIMGLAMLLSGLGSKAVAQSFHDNDWTYVASTHPRGQVNALSAYSYGPMDITQFYPFLSANAYPGTLSGPDPALWCLSSEYGGVTRDPSRFLFTQSVATVDRILKVLKSHSKWMVGSSQSFGEITTYATGPLYEFTDLPVAYYLENTGRQVNYIGCTNKIRYMATNTRHAKDSSFFITVGPEIDTLKSKPMVLDFAPMHELVHLHQNNYAPYKVAPVDYSKVSLDWIIEGTADAIGIQRIHGMYGGHQAVLRKMGPYSDGAYRRFYLLRNYNLPLNFSTANSQAYSVTDLKAVATVDKKMWDMFGYETNGFWFHIIERYLSNDSGKFTSLFKRLTTQNIDKVTEQVDKFLDRHDGTTLRGLEHVYPQFLAEFNNWWDYRTAGRISEKKWMNIAYNGCKTFDLSVNKPKQTQSFGISDYAGKCINLTISADAAKRLNDVQLVVAGADQTSDDIYLGVSRITGTKGGTVTCYDIVEQRGIATAPCLVDPHQGFANWKGGAGTTRRTLLRTFNLTDLQAVSGQVMTIQLVVVRVPTKHYDVVGQLKRKSLDLTISLDLASLKAKSSGKQPNKRAVSKFAGRQGEGPVSPDGIVDATDGTLERALRGEVARHGIIGLSPAALERLITVELIDEDDTNFMVGFILKDPLKDGVTGPVDVTGVMGDRKIDGAPVISYQDPQKPSTLEILEYDEATLRFRGQVNVCAGPLSDLMKNEADLCQYGERLSFDVEGAIAFPSLLKGASTFSLHKTPAYDAYKDLRMARLGFRTGNVMPDVGRPSGGDPDGPQTVSGGGNGADSVCTIRKPDQSCDCSCAAKACLDGKRATQTATGRELSCRLTCGKRWQECPVP